MRTVVALLLIVGTAFSMPAAAQWMWRDANGKPVFSDRPPPADIPDKSIVQRPSGAARAAPPVAAAAPSPASPAAPAPASGQDKELEQRRQQAEAAEAAKQKAAQDVQAKARAENCARARQNKASLDSGIRITRTSPQGEREFLDDAQRAAETRRTQDVIARDCAP
jgi:type IV secretory pathway VirB10-like protein